MATKMGRPVTYQSDAERPVTVSIKVEPALYEQLKQYAYDHRYTVTELVRAGIVWRLTQPGPQETRPVQKPQALQGVEPVQGVQVIHYVDLGKVEQKPQVIHPVDLGKVEQTARTITMHIDKLPQATATGYPVEPPQTSTTGEPAQDVQATHGAHHTPPQDPLPVEASPPTIPPYDTAKYHLGKLCPSQDEWGTTGQSLRNADNQCLECRARKMREKRAQKRQAQRQEDAGHASLG